MARRKTPSTTKTTKPDEPDAAIAFEDAMDELESLIRAIESGELTLEASIEAYERGIQLVADCRSSLGSAEQRVIDLTKRLEQADTDE